MEYTIRYKNKSELVISQGKFNSIIKSIKEDLGMTIIKSFDTEGGDSRHILINTREILDITPNN